MSDERESPLVTFYRFFPNGRPPQPADRSAVGTMPTRAFRYCEAMTSASAFGWYLFPPMRFSFVWDGGTDVIWNHEGTDDWYPLTSAQYPNFVAHFNSFAPEEFRDYCPPFLAAFKEPGIVQIWTGLVARTAPGWSLLVRPPANLPRSQGYDFFEGIIETDRWYGPLFTNVRLTRTNAPIEFDPEFPLLQVQPVHRSVYGGEAIADYRVAAGLGGLEPRDWEAFHQTVIKPSADPNRPRGAYGVSTRKRRASDKSDEP